MAHNLTLFGLSRSVYTRIAAIALLEKDLEYALQEVEIFGPEGAPEEHISRHPFGRIPVLQHGDMLVYETQAICRYLDEAFDGRSLQPAAPAARARMNQTIGILDAYGYRAMVWDVFVQRVRVPLRGGTPDEAVVSGGLRQVHKVLDVLAGLLSSENFLAGDTLTLADIHAYPMLACLGLAPEGCAAIEERPALVRWLGAMSLRASVVRTRTQYERDAQAQSAA